MKFCTNIIFNPLKNALIGLLSFRQKEMLDIYMERASNSDSN
jgi:hypothetical protein